MIKQFKKAAVKTVKALLTFSLIIFIGCKSKSNTVTLYEIDKGLWLSKKYAEQYYMAKVGDTIFIPGGLTLIKTK